MRQLVGRSCITNWRDFTRHYNYGWRNLCYMTLVCISHLYHSNTSLINYSQSSNSRRSVKVLGSILNLIQFSTIKCNSNSRRSVEVLGSILNLIQFSTIKCNSNSRRSVEVLGSILNLIQFSTIKCNLNSRQSMEVLGAILNSILYNPI